MKKRQEGKKRLNCNFTAQREGTFEGRLHPRATSHAATGEKKKYERK